MTNETTSEKLAEQLKAEIPKATSLLKNTVMLADVADILHRNKLEDWLVLLQKSPENFISKLAEEFICELPEHPRLAFQKMAERLKPLHDITVLLNPDKLNQWVQIRPDTCRMKDSRMPLEQFKEKVKAGVFGL